MLHVVPKSSAGAPGTYTHESSDDVNSRPCWNRPKLDRESMPYVPFSRCGPSS
jgi:hypothetical protein